MMSTAGRNQSRVSKESAFRIARTTAALLVVLGVGIYLRNLHQRQQLRAYEAADTLLLTSLNPPTALDRGNAIREIHGKDETLGILSMWVRIAQLKEACSNWTKDPFADGSPLQSLSDAFNNFVHGMMPSPTATNSALQASRVAMGQAWVGTTNKLYTLDGAQDAYLEFSGSYSRLSSA